MKYFSKEYFHEITPEWVSECMRGYDVPENIRQRVELISIRFNIKGSSDPMYIANTIAKENGTGDGHGNFQEAPIGKTNEIVKALMSAYSCNIFRYDKEDLETILMHGELSRSRMESGLRNSIRIRREWIRTIKDDAWKIEFLTGEIRQIHRTLKTYC